MSLPTWPRLPVDSWVETRDTLTLWLQVVGKVRIARSPLLNHWWNAPLYLNVRGLTTSLIPDRPGRSFAIDLDLVSHRLDITTTTGESSSLALEPRSVQDFYAELMGRLDELDLATQIWPVPVEIPDAIPFPDDDVHQAYDPTAVTAFWRTLVESERVLDVFRARFTGKSSAVHLFWGALDLATTRFSGRTAPPHPGGLPNCGPHVMHEAYSHEVSSAGYWPGGDDEGIFYSYAYPEPQPSEPVRPVRPPLGSTRPSESSCCPTPRCERPRTRTRCCWTSCSTATKRLPMRHGGTAPPSSAELLEPRRLRALDPDRRPGSTPYIVDGSSKWCVSRHPHYEGEAEP